MPIHTEVLEAARRLCRTHGTWTFTPDQVVRALPHLNPSSVRTHIVSRCCVNARPNHPHRWEYFRRLRRGEYEILPALRRGPRSVPAVAEPAPTYASHTRRPLHETIHAIVRRDRRAYVAECLELAVVTQGRSLDEVVRNLQDAVTLHLEGEVLGELGLASRPRIAVQYELPVMDAGAEA